MSEVERELRDALESMAFQYLTRWNDDPNDCTNLEHLFMSAGEQACRTLAKWWPEDWEDTGSGARWIGPLDEHGHPASHSWAAR